MLAAGLLLFTLVSVSCGRPTSQALLPRGQQEALNGFAKSSQHKGGGVPPSIFSPFPFIVALKSADPDGLTASLVDISNPTSPVYGNHLSKGEVESHIAPEPASVQVVKDWLAQHNISVETFSPSGNMLRLQVPSIESANTLFGANFTYYVHEKTNTTVLRTLSYSLSPEIQEHISWIYPTTQFIPPILARPSVKAARPRQGSSVLSRATSNLTDCATTVTPQCLQKLYNIPSAPASASGNSIAVSGFLNEVSNKTDLQQFLADFRPDNSNGTFDVESVDGGTDTGPGTPEASLDVQYTVGLATNVPNTFVSVGSQNQDGVLGFLDIINFLLAQDNLPTVLTTSFGFNEASFEQSPEVAQTLCEAYAQLGARGTTVLFASGDGGVSGSQQTSDCDTFVPTFPSTCPFVTSVGSTTGVPETAASFSAGGFSNIFPRPSYQDSAVEGYLTNLGQTYAGLFNASGRAYPDVSTQGSQFLVNVAGQVVAVNGTSASSPTFASIVALLNDRRMSAGQPPLGFLNPLLYQNASAMFNDITTGSNPGCNTNGFSAAVGWDPVTGLGTPDFNKLETAIGVSN